MIVCLECYVVMTAKLEYFNSQVTEKWSSPTAGSGPANAVATIFKGAKLLKTHACKLSSLNK